MGAEYRLTHYELGEPDDHVPYFSLSFLVNDLDLGGALFDVILIYAPLINPMPEMDENISQLTCHVDD